MDHAEWISSLQWQSLPDTVRRQARRCLKDVIAASAGSLSLPTARPIEELVVAQFGGGDLPLFFQTTRTTLSGAAFGNALRVDSLDCHDGFRPNKGHAGATVVPVALAACGQVSAPPRRPAAGIGSGGGSGGGPGGGSGGGPGSGSGSGAELLAGIVVGYEIALRAGLAIHKTYAPAYHGSGAWAAVGAAAAAARILSVPAEEVDGVLGAAEYYGPMSPILRCTANPCIVKDGAGAGAWAAGMAVAMREAGLRGMPSVFVDEPAGREQNGSLGDDWVMLRQYFKLYPTCRWTHAPVEALAQLRQEHPFRIEEIEGIEVESFGETSTLMKFPPEDSDGAQYCLPWAMAAMLVDGQLGVEQILPRRFSDERIVALGRKVAVRAAPDLQARFPKECLARVAVTLRGGRVLSSPITGARGDYDNPVTDEELDAKFTRLVATNLGDDACARLREVIETLDQRPAWDLLDLLGQPA